MNLLEVLGLQRSFSGGIRAVDDVSFHVDQGESFAIVGPSGCGKTTTLRLIVGFDLPDRGTVLLRKKDITRIPPERRGIGFVFQEHALFPHLSVHGNVAFGLRGLPRSVRRERALELLRLVGLGAERDRQPHQLSGGQQQRVALARALAPGPHIVLLDEPFNSLDAELRDVTRRDVYTLLRQARTASILVTHDQQEAMSFADRLAVMRSGHLEQVGTPSQVYRYPQTVFVARFLGNANVLSAVAHGADAATPVGTVPLTEERRGPVMIALRPEALGAAPDGEWEVVTCEYKGDHFLLRIAHGPTSLLVRSPAECALSPGLNVHPTILGRAVPLHQGTEGNGSFQLQSGRIPARPDR